MTRSLFVFVILLSGWISIGYSQETDCWNDDFPGSSGQLAFLADVMYNSVDPGHRVWASERFAKVLANEVSENFINGLMPFAWAQVQLPADSSFALITWQFKGQSGFYNPAGLLAFPDRQPVILKNDRESWEDPTYEKYSPENWPGAVYYRMLPENLSPDNQYILFGYHGWDGDNRVRVIEVLDLSNDEVNFGAPIFVMKDDPIRPDIISRKVLRYATQSKVQINYADTSGMILYDHLIPARTPEGKLSAVPDGSYEAFQWKDGKWQFVEKVFDQTQETPPGEGKAEEEKRDLFGRKQK